MIITKLACYSRGFVDDNHGTVDVDWARAERDGPAHTAQRQNEPARSINTFPRLRRLCDPALGKPEDSRFGLIQ